MHTDTHTYTMKSSREGGGGWKMKDISFLGKTGEGKGWGEEEEEEEERKSEKKTLPLEG